MRAGKPGISSFDMFATGHAIRQELKSMGGNLLGLNSSIMKLANGDDDSIASLDPTIGTREVSRTRSRQIGRTVSSTQGGLGPTSTPARSANLLGNPTIRRYEGHANGSYNFGLPGSPGIGQYYDVYESEGNRLRFLDETIGRDLLGYTHLENAAAERSEDAFNDEIYLKSTYSVFGDINYPFDNQDIEVFKNGPKRYSPSEPYVLKPLEDGVTRRTLNGHVQTFKDKFEAVVDGRGQYKGSLLDMWDYMGSHYYLNLLNGVAEHGLYAENYESDPKNRVEVYDRDAIPQSDYAYFLDVPSREAYIEGGFDGGIDWDNSGIRGIPDKEIKGLLNKTNRMFYEGKIKTLVNRFATLNQNNEGRPDFLNTATDHIYGLSRGRNLRKLNLTSENGYPNPYCRVWTTHYQYSKYKHLIRGKWADDGKNAGAEHYTLNQADQLMRPNNGYERLKNFTSLDPENGRPVFTPYYVNDRNKIEEDSIKRCMFSIENLAWKDIIPDSTLIRKQYDENGEEKLTNVGEEDFDAGIKINGSITSSTKAHSVAKLGAAKGFGMTLTKEQRGPNGGRIMWFPPYNLKFSEQSHADWNQNEFIGRGEKIYSYVNSERTGTLSFTILVDHPSIINEWTRGGKMGKTANKVSPLSKDEMILRYFAGCDSLDFNPREEYDVPYTSVTTEKTSLISETRKEPIGEDKNEKAVKREDPNEVGDVTFYSVFYFPNNYACEDYNEGTLSGGPKAALDMMFEEGVRANGEKGYERGYDDKTYPTITGKTCYSGMTYEGTYYHRGKVKNGDTKEWYYPVDSRVNNEVLVNAQRYKDTQDFGLNGSKIYGDFWGGVPSESEIVDYLNKGNTGITESKHLKEAKGIVFGTEADKIENKYFIPAYNFYKNLAQIIKVFNAATKNRYKYDIDVQGYASKHGYTESNKILAENRAAVIEGWIKSLDVFTFGEGGNAKIGHNGNGEIENTNMVTESDFRPKAARAAVVRFKISPAETDITKTQEFEESPHYKEVINTSITKESVTKEFFDTSKSDDYKNQTYDNEYTYFKQISENDDMVKRYISDKVDYFDPAFHSITPEGFNARLTFLQQCVRQGPTISASDLGMGSSFGAGNLSFGRAPFCVLRIGDFFNTKICIQNINIEYDNNGIQWDLNPEGVGLQPMMANVNISFTFLGGSDISGPIARLQNAASFNYYANTSVYDRRSDYRESYITEKNDKAMTWSPILLNKNEDANVISHREFWTRTSDSTDVPNKG